MRVSLVGVLAVLTICAVVSLYMESPTWEGSEDPSFALEVSRSTPSPKLRPSRPKLAPRPGPNEPRPGPNKPSPGSNKPSPGSNKPKRRPIKLLAGPDPLPTNYSILPQGCITDGHLTLYTGDSSVSWPGTATFNSQTRPVLSYSIESGTIPRKLAQSARSNNAYFDKIPLFFSSIESYNLWHMFHQNLMPLEVELEAYGLLDSACDSPDVDDEAWQRCRVRDAVPISVATMDCSHFKCHPPYVSNETLSFFQRFLPLFGDVNSRTLRLPKVKGPTCFEKVNPVGNGNRMSTLRYGHARHRRTAYRILDGFDVMDTCVLPQDKIRITLPRHLGSRAMENLDELVVSIVVPFATTDKGCSTLSPKDFSSVVAAISSVLDDENRVADIVPTVVAALNSTVSQCSWSESHVPFTLVPVVFGALSFSSQLTVGCNTDVMIGVHGAEFTFGRYLSFRAALDRRTCVDALPLPRTRRAVHAACGPDSFGALVEIVPFGVPSVGYIFSNLAKQWQAQYIPLAPTYDDMPEFPYYLWDWSQYAEISRVPVESISNETKWDTLHREKPSVKLTFGFLMGQRVIVPIEGVIESLRTIVCTKVSSEPRHNMHLSPALVSFLGRRFGCYSE